MNSSLNTLAIQLSRRLAWKLALAFTAVLSLLVFLYFWSSKQETIETLANGMEKNFSYWMTVGDQFQIQRAILALGRQASIQSVTLFDKRSGMIIGSFQKKSAHNYFPKVSFSFPIRNELGQALGSLEVSFELSLVPFLLVSLLGMALVFLLARVLERSALRLTAEILQPVDKLVGALGKSTQVSDLANLRYEPENFIEIKKIAEVIQTMGCRVEENERALREAEKGESVRKVTRQLAHDIRSPLSALRILAQQHQQFAQAESKLFQTAIDRIESLAEGMLSASKLAEQNPLGGEIGEHSYS
ncbi:MAG: hypothetical protein KDD35_01585, partial [Bdellovibrionales bacterium]|nr:hypothetical protein [Bdellovibrionales bacterium]